MNAVIQTAMPSEDPPRRIALWLELNGIEWWRLMVCKKCGGWVTDFDTLAPYQTNENYCKKCGYQKDLEETDNG